VYDLSIIIPVYNEQHILQQTLMKLNSFVKKNKNKIEVIFVNDGSTDLSAKIIKRYIYENKLNKKKSLFFKLITYSKNIGKGYAVKKGVLNSKYSWILICDSDFSTNPSEFHKWYNKNLILKNEINFAYFGSRNHKLSKIKASFLRVCLGMIFRLITYIFFKITLKDTQCGFKVFHKKYAKKLFRKIKSHRYTFDIELILLLNKSKINIKELPIKWIHKPGSKLNLFTDIPNMFWDILKIKKNLFN